MIATADLRKLARARLTDAQVLYRGSRYDAAVYFCGYVVEIALKARICQTLKWKGFPETNKEFQAYQSFKTHDLNILLNLSGIGTKIDASSKREWSVVSNWNPEIRYRSIGTATQVEAQEMIDAVTALLKVI